MVDMVYQVVSGIRRQGNQLNFRCPLCGDGKKRTSKRGHWYISTGTYYCWNAGCIAYQKGLSGLQFLSKVTGKSQVQIKTELLKRVGNLHKVIQQQNINQKINIFQDLKSRKRTKNFIQQQIFDNKWCQVPSQLMKQVVNKRKIYQSPFIDKDWKLYYDKQKNRLVIPWNDQYYQQRAITKQQQEQQGKYLFPPQIDKPIFGLNNIDTSFKYLFLLQGVFDAIWVKNGLAVGSLVLSNKQKQILENYKDYTIVYFMDNQFKDKSSFEQTKKISIKNPYQKIFIWPNKLKNFKDVNETIIYSDQFIKLWSNQKFLISRIANGIKANLLLNL